MLNLGYIFFLFLLLFYKFLLCFLLVFYLLQEKLAQVRLVSRAKCCLIELGHMTEAEAHRYIEKKAMDTRRDRAEVAQEILDSYDPAQ